MSKKNNKKKKWIKPRHRVVREILNLVLRPYSYLKYGVRAQKFKEQEKRPYLVLYNHQTAFDQFFVGMSFHGTVYYLATEDIFSNGFVSSLIRYLAAPIPIKKQTTDIKAILNCLKVAKEGGTIAIAPEGNRTYSGRTEYMSPSIVPLARKLGMPIALYRIEGGYGVHPRWSDVVRKGKMRGYVSKVIYPEEYANMTDDELFCEIKNELYVNEAVADANFKHKKSAEYLERAIYYCHDCGLSTFESHRNIIECKKCGRRVKYLPTKELEGVGFDFPYRFVVDWYDAQSDFTNGLDVLQYADEPMWRDTAALREVIPYKKKELLCKSAEMSLYGNRIEIASDDERLDLPFDELQAVAVLGKNKLNIYHKDKIYQIKGDKRFNALKYVHIYHRYKNMIKGDADGKLQFLGL
ncbi:MAG: 1-acyl-sn-glycerol-3-phosphate acyltransferase [Clostridia bacterium]|nr:1-acyl-sn-glycerol-3-phosphate acyltransferase [Clostridia bacterium]